MLELTTVRATVLHKHTGNGSNGVPKIYGVKMLFEGYS